MVTRRRMLRAPALPQATGLLAEARAALVRGDWRAGAAQARASLAAGETAEAHALLGLAAWWLSDITTLFRSRIRAYHLYLAAGQRRSAARIATWLDWDFRAFRGEPAVANGWLRRARRLLGGDRQCAEYGWLLLREADARLARNAASAARGAAAAAALGRRFRDVDLEYLALSLEGLARVAAGRVAEGMGQLDEATAAVVAGDFVDRSAAGATCCHLIMACELVRDFDRAGQWCGRVRAYCEEWDHPPLFAVCRTQYAGVLISGGQWTEAEAELGSAVAELARLRPGWITLGELQLADLRRRQGRLDDAAALFSRFPASPTAWLGSASIALERGVPAEAERLARRFLRQVPAGNHTARAAALELIVLASAATGRSTAGASEHRELRALAARVDSDALRGSSHLASGAIAAARGLAAAAREALEEAAVHFDRARAPYDSLRARVMLAAVLHACGEQAAALAEARGAAAQASALGARSLAAQAMALGRTPRSDPASPSALTRREREVLAHLALGLTNRQIAARLSLSQHTVHRHVANVFGKLGLSTRAAAVAYALQRGLGGPAR